jgi:hypothetical protein
MSTEWDIASDKTCELYENERSRAFFAPDKETPSEDEVYSTETLEYALERISEAQDNLALLVRLSAGEAPEMLDLYSEIDEHLAVSRENIERAIGVSTESMTSNPQE